MKLHFQKLGEGEPLVILHGLFGASDNWLTLGKKLADQYTVYLVDQRNHGRSPHSDQFNYDLLATDVFELMKSESLARVNLVGHSMGGKTAMRFAQLFPERVHKLVVVDIGVKAYPPRHDTILEGLKAIDVTHLTSRNEAEEQMKEYISDLGTRQFLLKSLYRKDKDTFAWRINIPALEEAMPLIMSALPNKVIEAPTFFISGSKSDYILTTDQAGIKEIFTDVRFAELPAGHWVHADNPDGLEELLREFVTP